MRVVSNRVPQNHQDREVKLFFLNSNNPHLFALKLNKINFDVLILNVKRNLNVHI